MLGSADVIGMLADLILTIGLPAHIRPNQARITVVAAKPSHMDRVSQNNLGGFVVNCPSVGGLRSSLAAARASTRLTAPNPPAAALGCPVARPRPA